MSFSDQTGCVSRIRYQVSPVRSDDEVEDNDCFHLRTKETMLLRQSIRDGVLARKLNKFQELGYDI